MESPSTLTTLIRRFVDEPSGRSRHTVRQQARTFTFLFTDIQGSTRLWENHPEAMQHALTRHDVLLRSAIE